MGSSGRNEDVVLSGQLLWMSLAPWNQTGHGSIDAQLSFDLSTAVALSCMDRSIRAAVSADGTYGRGREALSGP